MCDIFDSSESNENNNLEKKPASKPGDANDNTRLGEAVQILHLYEQYKQAANLHDSLKILVSPVKIK